jgi:hypothetical protein
MITRPVILFLLIFIPSLVSAQIKYFTGESNDIDGNGTADFSIENSHSSYSGLGYIMHTYKGTFTPLDELQIQFGTQTVGVYRLVEFNNFGDTIGSNRQCPRALRKIHQPNPAGSIFPGNEL